MDEKWMLKAIQLAEKGAGFVNPNPKVGALIVKDGTLIGEGYHQSYGSAHAEINAIQSAVSSCEGATIYVTLEPCFHYGKTPPCLDAILREKFKRVVIGMVDPNPLVSGQSVAKLLREGVEVSIGVMEEDCKDLNPGFIKRMRSGMPYVLMKTAMTLDGKIATRTGDSRWISGESSRKMVHELRHEHQGIMVGIATVLADDPLLTVRRETQSAQPTRIIVDTHGKLPIESKIAQTAKVFKTLLITTENIDPNKVLLLTHMGIQVEKVGSKDNRVDLNDMMKRLGALSINSVLLEGGSTLNSAMLSEGLVDEVITFISPKIFGGKSAHTPVGGIGVDKIDDAYKISKLKMAQIGEDVILRGKVMKPCLQD